MGKREKVRGMILEVVENVTGYKLEELKRGDDLRLDLGFDEMEFAKIAIELEDEFGVEIEEGWSVRMVTVEDLLKSRSVSFN